MVPKDLKRLIDELDIRVNALEAEVAFKDQEIQRLEAEIDRLNIKLLNTKMILNADYRGVRAQPRFYDLTKTIIA